MEYTTDVIQLTKRGLLMNITVLGESLVTTAWRVLRLQMEETASIDMEGRCR
jgi:hypothetical protein